MSEFLNFNGTILPSGEPLLRAGNRGFRYGDGLFETMRFQGGRIQLGDYHFERLLTGLRLLQFRIYTDTQKKFIREIKALCEKNGHGTATPGTIATPGAGARVRLTVFRGEEGPGDPDGATANYIIETSPLEAWSQELPWDGLTIGLFPGARKACDAFSALKSNNYLVYSMAALYARGQGWDDSLVLNSFGRIADSSIANLFYCRDGKVYTPPLSEGCVAGVMRRSLIARAAAAGFTLEEKETTVEDLEAAEEVFLTNAIRGIRPVSRFHRMIYTGRELTGALHRLLLTPDR